MERYPQDLSVGIDDFRRSNWKSAIASSEREGYSGMWQSLSAAARFAIKGDRTSEGKVLWLLADACSMMLNPGSVNEPFKPVMVMNGKRSSLPEDFEQSDVDLFSLIAEEVDDTWLQARLSDLVWLLKSPRSPKHALLAIDAYCRIPLDTETWVRGGRECWERAINLAQMLRTGAGERMKEIETAITAAFEVAKSEDGFLALWLADLLAANHLAHRKGTDIAKRLELLARNFDVEGDLHRAREFFAASAKWFQQAGDAAKTAEMTVFVAEGWVKEAVARISSDKLSHMVAASLYENAIQTYRSIPRSERAAHRVDERIAVLHKSLNEAGKRSMDEMGVISSPSIDITKLVENARNAVRGKSAHDALAAFANIYRGVRAVQMREFSEKMLREHPLQALISATHMSRDGRVIAKRPGMGLGDADSDDTQAAIWAEMVKHYGMEIGLVVQGDIWPALEVLVCRYSNGFTMGDFFQDSVNLFRPNKWFRIFIVYADKLFNGRYQIRYAPKYATPNTLAGDLSKPSFDKIQPRGRGRREVAMKAGMLFQPCLNPGMIVRTIVIQNHMNRQVFGSFTVDLPKKLPEFDVAMPGITRANDLPLQHIQRCEQAGGTVAFVIVCHRPAATFLHRQAGLCPIQRLYLRLLIHTQNDGLVRRVQVYPNHIRQLFNKPLVFRELEPFHAVWLQPVRIPNTRDCGIADSRGLCHSPRGPVSRIRGRRVQCRLHNRLDLFGRQGAGTQAVGRIFRQSLRTPFLKPFAPLHDRRTTGLQALGNGPVGQTISSQQANACTQHGSLGTCFGPHPGFQGRSLLFRHQQFFGWLPHEAICNISPNHCKDIIVTLH
jgi:hypothetical protein